MRTLQKLLVAGAAAIAVGASGAAWAQSPKTHVMTVRLPDGGIEQIQYVGDVPPQVSFAAGPAVLPVFASMPSLFGGDSPFAMMERISAEMDRRSAAMFRQIDAMATRAQSGQLTEAAMRNLPPGSQSYSFVSTMSGNGVCTRSVQITSAGNGTAPKVVSHSSGDCDGMTSGPGTANSVNLPGNLPGSQPGSSLPAVRAPAPTHRPDVLWTSADGPNSYVGLVRKVASNQR